MNDNLTKKLYDEFDFFHPEAPVTESCMCFGFECEDGWFQIIWDLSTAIKKCKPSKEFRVQQVKEKLAGLRYYVNTSTDEIDDLIDKAEAQSYKTCEACGKPGSLHHRGTWLKTLCSSCAKKYGYEKGEE